MTRLKMIASSLLVVAVAGLIAYPLYAHCGKCAVDGKKIAAQLDQNKTTLAKAVTAAEAHSKGRAISVISDLNEKGQLGVHVYCIVSDTSNANSSKIMKCHFDHVAGKVTGMKEVKEFPITPHAPDHARGHDPAHGDDHAKHHDPGSAKMIKNQTLEVACGACIYKMPGVEGCPLAIMIDGKPYLVEGATWPNHDYCDRTCQAVVTGKLEGNPPKFIATSVEEKK